MPLFAWVPTQLEVRDNTKLYYERNLNRLNASRLRDIQPADIHRILDELVEPADMGWEAQSVLLVPKDAWRSTAKAATAGL